MSTPGLEDALARRHHTRALHGISAVLLPFTPDGAIDDAAFARHVDRTRRSGLDVAVNMDTGFGDLLAAAERERVLDLARDALGGASRWYAAALADPGAADPVPSYHHEIGAITRRGGTPVIAQCPTMATLDPVGLADLYRQVVAPCDEALAFELSPVFATHGAIWSDDAFARLLDVPQLAGAKHSSLDRATELRRLAARDALRPEFRVYTGNDLAIDMVTYGSDYLLGLSTFAPEAFAARDRAFAAGSIDFLSWNDALQHLGNVGFRAPVPAYKHSAALYLQLTGALLHDAIHPGAPRRTDPDADRALLGDCARRLHDVEERSPSL